MIQIKNITMKFDGKTVLTDITHHVLRGSVTCIIGPSGSGKSTLLRCANGLEYPQAGRILIDGEQLISKQGKVDRKVRRKTGMVFQNFNLFPHFSALENVMAGPRYVLGERIGLAKKKGFELLESVGLKDMASMKPENLSGGQQQRVAIARALAMHPKAMLFDEVTSSLDPELVEGILRVMINLAKEGMTMIVVTHEMDFAEKVATEVIFMDQGRIVEKGKPNDIFKAPSSNRTRQFLSAVSHVNLA